MGVRSLFIIDCFGWNPLCVQGSSLGSHQGRRYDVFKDSDTNFLLLPDGFNKPVEAFYHFLTIHQSFDWFGLHNPNSDSYCLVFVLAMEVEPLSDVP